jgi:hypothetical protein
MSPPPLPRQARAAPRCRDPCAALTVSCVTSYGKHSRQRLWGISRSVCGGTSWGRHLTVYMYGSLNASQSRSSTNLLRKAPRFSSNSHHWPLAISPIPATTEDRVDRVLSRWMLFPPHTAINEKGLPLHPKGNPPRLRRTHTVDELCLTSPPHLPPAAQHPEYITEYRPKLSHDHDHDSETGAGGKGSGAVNLKHGSLWRPQPSCGTAHLNPAACGATSAVPGQVLDSMEELGRW